MRAARHTGGIAVDFLCRVAGRRNVVRAAQFTLERLRPDYGDTVRRRSRIALQAWALRRIPRGEAIHVVDAGANVGDWSRSFLDVAESDGRLDDVDVHAFEPCAETFRQLVEQLGDSAAFLRQVALSDDTGDTILYIAKESALNSIYHVPGTHTSSEDVATIALDGYAQQAELDRIDLLALDTTGHELAVLRGASGLLRERCIALITFQHNEFWIYAGTFLRDAFALLEPVGYRIAALTPQGLAFYPAWDLALENFRERIYVACTKDVAEELPRVESFDPASIYWHRPMV